jgi:hypothetical protein
VWNERSGLPLRANREGFALEVPPLLELCQEQLGSSLMFSVDRRG